PAPPASADAPAVSPRVTPPVNERQGIGVARPTTFAAPRSPQISAAPKPSAGKPQAITDFGGRRY
ncbi:MAG TPA: hypothetical protein VI197_29415, partial [Polyangiaceae bacterium]